MANLVVCWVYLSIIEHFIVTKPSLRRSNLIQFDSFHTCAHANWLVALASSHQRRTTRDATAKANLSTKAKQTIRKMKTNSIELLAHTLTAHMRQPTVNMDLSLTCASVWVGRLSKMATIYSHGCVCECKWVREGGTKDISFNTVRNSCVVYLLNIPT